MHEDFAASNAVAHESLPLTTLPDGHDAHEHGERDPHVRLDPMNAKTGNAKISAKRFLRRIRASRRPSGKL